MRPPAGAYQQWTLQNRRIVSPLRADNAVRDRTHAPPYHDAHRGGGDCFGCRPPARRTCCRGKRAEGSRLHAAGSGFSRGPVRRLLSGRSVLFLLGRAVRPSLLWLLVGRRSARLSVGLSLHLPDCAGPDNGDLIPPALAAPSRSDRTRATGKNDIVSPRPPERRPCCSFAGGGRCTRSRARGPPPRWSLPPT